MQLTQKTSSSSRKAGRSVLHLRNCSWVRNIPPFLTHVSVFPAPRQHCSCYIKHFLRNLLFTFLLPMCFIKVWGNCESLYQQNRRNRQLKAHTLNSEPLGIFHSRAFIYPMNFVTSSLHHQLLWNSARLTFNLSVAPYLIQTLKSMSILTP